MKDTIIQIMMFIILDKIVEMCIWDYVKSVVMGTKGEVTLLTSGIVSYSG